MLEGIFRVGLPFDSVLQFIVYGDPYIEKYFEAYRNTKTRPFSVSQAATEQTAKFFLDATR